MEELNSFYPKDQEEWRSWLRENHVDEDYVWLIIYKKDSSKPNLTWSEAVDQALCFGWIDSTIKPIDDESYRQYFCKRKHTSHWSKINKDKVKVLIEEGLMEEAGLKSIEIAKENGSWFFLDDVEALVMPNDLERALKSQNGAMEFYEGLTKSVKKSFLFWVKSAKREETREKRIMEIAENASQNMKPKPFR